MIDLHTHTDHSDGTCRPGELLQLAAEAGLDALAITDHDTFTGYEEAAALPCPEGLRLIRGIEITCKNHRENVHLLAYFPLREPTPRFREWLQTIHAGRQDRNLRLIQRLRELGLDLQLQEVEALGRHMTGRPHFARLVVAKGYASDAEDAFRRYLGESAAGFVERRGPSLLEVLAMVREAGGISSLAHPVRLGVDDEDTFIAGLAAAGLNAIEAYHPDHSLKDTERYLRIAERCGLGVTGGSDFHGSAKRRGLGSVQVDSKYLSFLLNFPE